MRQFWPSIRLFWHDPDQPTEIMERETGLEPRRQLGRTTLEWKQRQSRFQHVVLAIEFSPVSALCFARLFNGAQMEHASTTPSGASPWLEYRFNGDMAFKGY